MRDMCSGRRECHSSNPIRSPGTVLGWGVVTGLGQIDSYILSLAVKTGILGLVFFMGLLTLRFGTGCEIIFPTCQNPAHWQAR